MLYSSSETDRRREIRLTAPVTSRLRCDGFTIEKKSPMSSSFPTSTELFVIIVMRGRPNATCLPAARAVNQPGRRVPAGSAAVSMITLSR